MIDKIIPLVVSAIVGATAAGLLVKQSSDLKQQAALDEQKLAFRKEAKQNKGARDKASNNQSRDLEDRTKALEQAKARAIQLEGKLDYHFMKIFRNLI